MSKGWTPASRKGDVKRTGRQWHSGPPPHVGWWNASAYQHPNAWRWWDGQRWSVVVMPPAPAIHLARTAALHQWDQSCILWTDYWPEGARVPRVAP